MITQVVKPFDSDEQGKIKPTTQLTAEMEEVTLNMTKARFMINDILDQQGQQPGKAATTKAADFYLPVMAAAMAAYRPNGPALSLAASDTDLKEVANSEEDLGKLVRISPFQITLYWIFFRTLV